MLESESSSGLPHKWRLQLLKALYDVKKTNFGIWTLASVCLPHTLLEPKEVLSCVTIRGGQPVKALLQLNSPRERTLVIHYNSTSDFEKNLTPFIIACAVERIVKAPNQRQLIPRAQPAGLWAQPPPPEAEGGGGAFLNRCPRGLCLKYLWLQSLWNNWLNL